MPWVCFSDICCMLFDYWRFNLKHLTFRNKTCHPGCIKFVCAYMCVCLYYRSGTAAVASYNLSYHRRRTRHVYIPWPEARRRHRPIHSRDWSAGNAALLVARLPSVQIRLQQRRYSEEGHRSQPTAWHSICKLTTDSAHVFFC